MLTSEFKIEKAEHVLVTPIYVAFAYANAGPNPLSFSIGNGQADSYRFHAKPEIRVHDPYYEFGGLAAITEVGPGQSGENEILLNRYLQFLQPGKYVLACELDVEVTDETTDNARMHRVRMALDIVLEEDEERRQDVLASLEADLTGRNGAKQMRAAQALAELRSEAALPVLVRGLESKNSAVVEHLLRGLANTGGREARHTLSDFRASSRLLPLRIVARQELERMLGEAAKRSAP